MRALIAESDEVVQRQAAKALSEEGAAVLTARNGKQALELASREAPDVILLDIEMPKADGYALFKKLREQPSTKTIPIVLITTETVEVAEAELERPDVWAGAAYAYLRGPFTYQSVRDAVKGALKLNAGQMPSDVWAGAAYAYLRRPFTSQSVRDAVKGALKLNAGQMPSEEVEIAVARALVTEPKASQAIAQSLSAGLRFLGSLQPAEDLVLEEENIKDLVNLVVAGASVEPQKASESVRSFMSSLQKKLQFSPEVQVEGIGKVCERRVKGALKPILHLEE